MRAPSSPAWPRSRSARGDAFGLAVLGNGRVHFLPAARGPRQLQRVLAQLARTQAEGALPDAAALRSGLRFAGAPALVFAASDFLDWPSSLSDVLVRLRHMRHDVRVACLQTEAECTGGFDSGPAYRDPEGQAGVFRFGSDLREGYLREREAHFAAVSAACRANDIPKVDARIEQAPGEVLRQWLKPRGRR
ncbi:hypothetical protein [Massilia sp. Se16.2.3]|uniref:DUF58 domain-containing protein n=1 Tax=Massilia sp. Se16.2.3 TaxID=2709303 RepID=UPI001E62A823|nr:hypothetical protein [Massilia sp. Se16.2.3]